MPIAGLAVERWHHDLNVLMLEVQTGVLGPLAPPDDKRRSAVYRMYDACRYGRMYYLRLLEDYQWCELGVNVFSESYK